MSFVTIINYRKTFQEFARELGDNNIQVLIEEADKIDGIEPELKDELKDLNERWDKIHDATKDRTESYEDLMSKWGAFREQQLTLLNWVDEKDAEATGGKEQVNLADEDETAEYIKKLKVRFSNSIVLQHVSLISCYSYSRRVPLSVIIRV